jgi:hypothetical protein
VTATVIDGSIGDGGPMIDARATEVADRGTEVGTERPSPVPHVDGPVSAGTPCSGPGRATCAGAAAPPAGAPSPITSRRGDRPRHRRFSSSGPSGRRSKPSPNPGRLMGSPVRSPTVLGGPAQAGSAARRRL